MIYFMFHIFIIFRPTKGALPLPLYLIILFLVCSVRLPSNTILKVHCMSLLIRYTVSKVQCEEMDGLQIV